MVCKLILIGQLMINICDISFVTPYRCPFNGVVKGCEYRVSFKNKKTLCINKADYKKIRKAIDE